MVVFKTIKLPHLLRQEKYTRRGRKYYTKKTEFKNNAKYLKLILTLALLCLVLYAAVFANSTENAVDINQYFKTESGAYTVGLLDKTRIDKADCSLKNISENSNNPLIVIFHTHFSESYADKKENGESYTVADAGEELADIFADKYNLTVVHDVGEYDVVNGTIHRDGSYERSGNGITEIMKKYPSAQIFIDLHRDAYKDTGGENYVKIDNKKCAVIMPVIGVCGIDDNGTKKSVNLENRYIDENLKFAYNFKINCDKINPDFCKKIYLKSYRYSTYVAPCSLLLEVGNEKSNFEEVKNSLEAVAKAVVKTASIN